jgi:DNA-binding CsgD family transcriptional regulator
MFTEKNNNDALMTLYHSKSAEELNDTFKIICEDYFIEKFALATLLKTKTLHNSQLFSTLDNYPPEWMDHYKSQKYYLDDPVFLRAQQIAIPCYWHIDKFSDINKNQKKILVEASDFGIKRGTIVPLLPNGKMSGLLSLIDTNIQHPEVLHVLSNASHIYLNRKEYFELRNKFNLLTDKEMQVLSLKAEGYRIKQISSELSISDATVLFHLKNLKKKLGFMSTEQVIFKYISADCKY